MLKKNQNNFDIFQLFFCVYYRSVTVVEYQDIGGKNKYDKTKLVIQITW